MSSFKDIKRKGSGMPPAAQVALPVGLKPKPKVVREPTLVFGNQPQLGAL